MVQTAREIGRTFGVAYYRRAYPKVQRAKQLLDAGAIGKPFLAELACHEWRERTSRVIAVGCSILHKGAAVRSTTSPLTASMC